MLSMFSGNTVQLIIYTLHYLLLLFLVVWMVKSIPVKNWQDFLDSLSTSGGNIVTLFICSALAGTLWIWMANHMKGSDLTTAAGQIFAGFTGALLQAHKGNTSKQQMIDRGQLPATPPQIPQLPQLPQTPQQPVTPVVVVAPVAPVAPVTPAASVPAGVPVPQARP